MVKPCGNTFEMPVMSLLTVCTTLIVTVLLGGYYYTSKLEVAQDNEKVKWRVEHIRMLDERFITIKDSMREMKDAQLRVHEDLKQNQRDIQSNLLELKNMNIQLLKESRLMAREHVAQKELDKLRKSRKQP
jgi:hypothetical protein